MDLMPMAAVAGDARAPLPRDSAAAVELEKRDGG